MANRSFYLYVDNVPYRRARRRGSVRTMGFTLSKERDRAAAAHPFATSCVSATRERMPFMP